MNHSSKEFWYSLVSDSSQETVLENSNKENYGWQTLMISDIQKIEFRYFTATEPVTAKLMMEYHKNEKLKYKFFQIKIQSFKSWVIRSLAPK